jgi:hypothetical protein
METALASFIQRVGSPAPGTAELGGVLLRGKSSAREKLCVGHLHFDPIGQVGVWKDLEVIARKSEQLLSRL